MNQVDSVNKILNVMIFSTHCQSIHIHSVLSFLIAFSSVKLYRKSSNKDEIYLFKNSSILLDSFYPSF